MRKVKGEKLDVNVFTIETYWQDGGWCFARANLRFVYTLARGEDGDGGGG